MTQLRENVEHFKQFYASFSHLGERMFFSLTYLDILALMSVKQIEGHRWGKLCKTV